MTKISRQQWSSLKYSGKLGLVFCVLFMLLKVISIITNTVSYVEKKQLLKEEVTHVAFLKVHKTASSSVQNIFIRFGDHRNLTFMMASVKHNECGGKSPHCISFYNSLTNRNIIPPPQNRTYEVMCSHVIYNKERFQRYFQPDTKYISLIREPVDRLASTISYFKLLKGIKLSQYADNPIKYDHIRLNNAMAYEFGFQKELFPNAKHPTLSKDDLREIDEYTQQLIKDFTLIMITERLPESLVLMKRLLNWKTQDILIWTQVTGNHSKFSETDKSKLKSYLRLDYVLYATAVRELESKIQQAGPGFEDEVQNFIALNKIVSKHCKSKTSSMLSIKASRWNSEFNVTRQFCTDFTLDESAYFRNIRIKQYGTLDTA